MKWPAAISDCAEDDGAALAEHAVGEEAAEDRREIHQAGVEAVDLRRERLHIERPEHDFECVPQAGEAETCLSTRPAGAGT